MIVKAASGNVNIGKTKDSSQKPIIETKKFEFMNQSSDTSQKISIKSEETGDIRSEVERIWNKYDVERTGSLDKIETANFLNEILTIRG